MIPANIHANIFALNEEISAFNSYCHPLDAMVGTFRENTIIP